MGRSAIFTTDGPSASFYQPPMQIVDQENSRKEDLEESSPRSLRQGLSCSTARDVSLQGYEATEQ